MVAALASSTTAAMIALAIVSPVPSNDGCSKNGGTGTMGAAANRVVIKTHSFQTHFGGRNVDLIKLKKKKQTTVNTGRKINW